MNLLSKYPYFKGEKWYEAMETWASGGKAVSLHAFPWKDWLALTLVERMHLFLQRERFIEQYGYALPNAEFIQACLRHGPLLEIGAGTGFLSLLLNQEGADVIATDLGKRDYVFEPGQLFPILDYSAQEAVQHFKHRTVLLAWPCYHESWAKETLTQIQSGQKLIYIGEGKHGCNATSGFFEELDKHFSMIEQLPWKSFPYIQDRATVYLKH